MLEVNSLFWLICGCFPKLSTIIGVVVIINVSDDVNAVIFCCDDSDGNGGDRDNGVDV